MYTYVGRSYTRWKKCETLGYIWPPLISRGVSSKWQTVAFGWLTRQNNHLKATTMMTQHQHFIDKMATSENVTICHQSSSRLHLLLVLFYTHR